MSQYLSFHRFTFHFHILYVSMESPRNFNGCIFSAASAFTFPIPYSIGTVSHPIKACKNIREGTISLFFGPFCKYLSKFSQNFLCRPQFQFSFSLCTFHIEVQTQQYQQKLLLQLCDLVLWQGSPVEKLSSLLHQTLF